MPPRTPARAVRAVRISADHNAFRRANALLLTMQTQRHTSAQVCALFCVLDGMIQAVRLLVQQTTTFRRPAARHRTRNVQVCSCNAYGKVFAFSVSNVWHGNVSIRCVHRDDQHCVHRYTRTVRCWFIFSAIACAKSCSSCSGNATTCMSCASGYIGTVSPVSPGQCTGCTGCIWSF